MKNIWLLTEERPKKNIIFQIVKKFADDNWFSLVEDNIIIVPILDINKNFTFTYRIDWLKCENVSNIYLKTVSWNSSFVDFLFFYQEEEPTPNSKPIYAIEETKTDDSESRNTWVYQRCSKFVFVDFYYPWIKKIMLYNLQIDQKESPTETNIFWTRMLLTIGVEILWKTIDTTVMKPFSSLEELIAMKDSMRMPPAGNVPIKIANLSDKITISGRLFKSWGLSHDPNIWALTIISKCIRLWEKTKNIVIILHWLSQNHIGKNNKFILIANQINIKLDWLTVPKAEISDNYWHYEHSSEKIASIFVHVIVENFSSWHAIYENHWWCERWYFYRKNWTPIAIPKYQDWEKENYKNWNKESIIFIPDLIIYDIKNNIIINVEGKKFSTRFNWIEELNNFDYIEKVYLIPEYNPKMIIRTVTVFWSNEVEIKEREIWFMMNSDWKLITNQNTPEIINTALSNLYSY